MKKDKKECAYEVERCVKNVGGRQVTNTDGDEVSS